MVKVLAGTVRPPQPVSITSDAFNQLARDVLMSLDQNHLLGLVVVVALTYGSRSAWLAWLQNRKEMHHADLSSSERITLSEQDTQRLKLIEQFRQQDLRSVMIQANADEGRRRMLAAMRPGDEVDVAGIQMNREEAASLTRKPRMTAQPVRIDGIYRILQVDASRDDCFTLKVQNPEDDQTLTALLPNTNISTEMQEVLQNAEWERRLVCLQINARRSGDRITNAEIVSCVSEEAPLS